MKAYLKGFFVGLVLPGGLGLVLILGVMSVVNHSTVVGDIAGIEELRATVAAALLRCPPMEPAVMGALATEVLHTNKKIASEHVDNGAGLLSDAMTSDRWDAVQRIDLPVRTLTCPQ